VLGALTGTSRVARSYSRQDLDLLESIAHQLSISIDHATLYIKTRAMVDQLREADRFKTDFFSNISHELKTPLTAINGYSELLLAGMGGELSITQCEYIDNIQSSGTMLLDIINNLLDLSRIRAGKMERDFGEVSVTGVISKAMKAVKPLAAKKAQSLQSDLPDESLVLQADEHKVQHILLNLLSNAVKFTPHGGSIVVQARAATLASQPAVELSVIDNGVGIKPENHGRIFEEFTQADSSHTREHTGSGLGLAIVRRFVEMHDGVITVDSQPGKGSRFTVLLPRRIDLESAAGPGEALDHLTLGQAPGRAEWVDAMTGLSNEAYLRDRLDRCLQHESEEQSVSLLMVRIGGFANYNAQHGRSAGDVAIQELARLLRSQLHQSDMVCRCYGSTFGVVLAHTTTEAAAAVSRRLQHLSPSDSLTLSVSVAGWSADGGSGVAWLERATRALAEEEEGGSHILT
jgi:diguanylate cyclase (GGDEF)-like protein